MKSFDYFFIIALVVFLTVWGFSSLYGYFKVRKLRSLNLYPAPGTATMQHVENLVRAGEKAYAMRAYREVHPSASLRQAKEAVQAIVNAT